MFLNKLVVGSCSKVNIMAGSGSWSMAGISSCVSEVSSPFPGGSAAEVKAWAQGYEVEAGNPCIKKELRAGKLKAELNKTSRGGEAEELLGPLEMRQIRS